MISEYVIKRMIPNSIKNTDFPELGQKESGKVRDKYIQEDKMILITTDRISAFDVIFRQSIPFKGQALTQTAIFWFNETRDIIQNHLIASPDPNIMIVRKCKVWPVEMVVRGYVTGHLWREYLKGKRELCGVHLPDGLKENQKLPEPILTPTTKSSEGDEDISRQEIIDRNIVPEDIYIQMEKAAMALFKRGTEHCAKNNLILVDTKYEFGDYNGELMLIDEVHTGDSSRFWVASEYEKRFQAGEKQRALDKEYVRQWSIQQGFTGMHPDAAREGMDVLTEAPDIPEDVIITASQRYIESYEKITGKEFEPANPDEPVSERIGRAMASEIAGGITSETLSKPESTEQQSASSLSTNSNIIVPIIMGSKADLEFCQKISKALESLGVPFQFRVASAHKTPSYLMDVLTEYENSGKFVVYITVAGMSNGLSGSVAANTKFPVIACPPMDKYAIPIDIYSSLRMPSNVPSLVVLSPKNAALAAAKILALNDPELQEKIANDIEDVKQGIKSADEEVR